MEFMRTTTSSGTLKAEYTKAIGVQKSTLKIKKKSIYSQLCFHQLFYICTNTKIKIKSNTTVKAKNDEKHNILDITNLTKQITSVFL